MKKRQAYFNDWCYALCCVPFSLKMWSRVLLKKNQAGSDRTVLESEQQSKFTL